MQPAAIPANRIWMKKAMSLSSSLAAPSLRSRLRWAGAWTAAVRRRRSPAPKLFAQVRPDHVGVRLHRGRLALGDHTAEVQHEHTVGDAHDHRHVVLDENLRDAELLLDVEDDGGH